jgi:hypothetical protein
MAPSSSWTIWCSLAVMPGGVKMGLQPRVGCPEAGFNLEVRRSRDARWMTVADMNQDELDLDINADWQAGWLTL